MEGGETINMKSKNISDRTGICGFFRVNIVENKGGKKIVVGDSGWRKNMLVNLGVQHFIVEQLASIAGSSVISYAALGSGGTVASTLTAIPAECAVAAGRFAVVGSVASSRTLRYTGSLQSNVLAATTIGNIGLYAVSTTNAGSMLAGNTFASSALATNQAVNVTYDIQFP